MVSTAALGESESERCVCVSLVMDWQLVQGALPAFALREPGFAPADPGDSKLPVKIMNGWFPSFITTLGYLSRFSVQPRPKQPRGDTFLMQTRK